MSNNIISAIGRALAELGECDQFHGTCFGKPIGFTEPPKDASALNERGKFVDKNGKRPDQTKDIDPYREMRMSAPPTLCSLPE